MKIIGRCLSVLSLVLWGNLALACVIENTANSLKGTGEVYAVSVTTIPAQVMVGKPFSVRVSVCSKKGQSFLGDIKINAMMPMHKHGMNYKPSIEKISDGKFEMKGFVFHMPGKWQYKIDLKQGDSSDKVLIDYKL
ncbi:MAG: hypothetical protein V7727_08695 [Sneathiella sp.]